MLIGEIGNFTREFKRPSWVFNKLMKNGPDILSDKLPFVLWVVDNRGVFTAFEGKELLGLGIKPNEVVGQSIFDVFASLPQVIEIYHLAMEGRNLNEVVLKRDQKIWNIHCTPTRDENGQISGAFGIANNITQLKKLNKVQGSVLRIDSELGNAITRAEMYSIIQNNLIEIFQISNCAILSKKSITGELLDEFVYGDWLAEKKSPRSNTDYAWIIQESKRILSNGSPYAVEKGFSDPNSSNGSYISGTPLTARDEKLGVLWIGRTTPFSEDEKQWLVEIGEMIGKALYRALQLERSNRRLQRFEALHAIDKALIGSLDIQVVLQVFLDQVVQNLEIDAADVFLHNRDHHSLRYSNGLGFTYGSLMKNSFQLGEGLPGSVALQRKQIKIDKLQLSSIPIVRKSLIAKEKFVAYLGIPLITRGKLMGVLEIFHRKPIKIGTEWADFIKTLADQAAIATDTLSQFSYIKKYNAELEHAYDATLISWGRALDLREQETESQIQRIIQRTEHLSRVMGISEEELVNIRRGVILHDIGKIGISDEILKKSGPLTGDEWMLVRNHPLHAFEMLKQIEFLLPALDIPYYHHERWDGSGYPQGLKGEQIPLTARIFAVIDVWECLSSDRPYRKAWPEDKIIKFILAQAGKQFDPRVVEAWAKAFNIPVDP